MQTPITNHELCMHFDVWAYPVESQDADPPPKEVGKFFVSTNLGDFGNAAETIPLSDSFDAAEALAVENLRLRALYDLELKHGPLPRHVPAVL